MSQVEKLYEKIVNNRKNVSFEDLDRVLQHFGFKKREGKGSHVVFYHDDILREHLSVPKQRPVLKSAYVNKAIELIALVKEDS